MIYFRPKHKGKNELNMLGMYFYLSYFSVSIWLFCAHVESTHRKTAFVEPGKCYRQKCFLWNWTNFCLFCSWFLLYSLAYTNLAHSDTFRTAHQWLLGDSEMHKKLESTKRKKSSNGVVRKFRIRELLPCHFCKLCQCHNQYNTNTCIEYT